jgi:hypothetical protein
MAEECATFGIHRTEEGGFGYKMASPAGIFIAELSDIFGRLFNIQAPEKFYTEKKV